VLAAESQVAVQGAGGLRAERHQPPLAAFASPDVQGPSAQVDVLDLEGDRLAGTQPRLGQQPDQGLVPAVAQRRPLTGGEQGTELLIGQDRDDLAVELRRLQAGQRVGVQLALLGQPGGEAAQGEWRARAVAASRPLFSSSAMNAATVGRSSVASRLCRSHQARKARTPVAYSRTVPSALRSARRWMIQLSSSARRSAGDFDPLTWPGYSR
jgi:hypothetical protein